jgi:exonuclease III
MAFRKKAGFILRHEPDILIVPECEHPDKLLFPPETPKPTDLLWYGDNPHKGIGIFSYSHFQFKIHDLYNKNFKLIIPVAVTGGPFEFNLLAIWANNPADKRGRYIEQVWKALHHYDSFLRDKPTFLAGDFNSNTIWDKEHRQGCHSEVVRLLEEKGIRSVYHAHHRQTQGAEQHPTYYLYRHKDRAYHIDYCFGSEEMLKQLRSVEIGGHKPWTKYSDHVPVIVTFNDH